MRVRSLAIIQMIIFIITAILMKKMIILAMMFITYVIEFFLNKKLSIIKYLKISFISFL